MPTSFRPSLLAVCGVAFATLLVAGCTAFERGAEQGDPVVDPKNGCPDLRGDYAFDAVDDDGQPDARFTSKAPAGIDAALFTPKSTTRDGPGDLSRFAGVGIRAAGDHGLEFRFVLPHTAVMQELERIRQDERPRYAEWYALMQPEARARYVADHGEAGFRERLEALGPATTRVVVLDQFRDYTCDGGWVVLPREYGTPVRMTLDPQGNLVFESKEYSGFQVNVWCGDGCKGFKVPTGAYLGVTTWPRTTSIRPWDADVVGQGFEFARPADVIEAEQAAYQADLRREAERRFATPDEVRAALTPLLPDGVAIQSVELSQLPFLGSRVRVVAVAADPAMPYEDQRRTQAWFLAKLREGDPGYIEDKEVVERAISGGGAMRHEMEIYLDTHPAVQPRPSVSGDRPTEAAATVTYTPPPAVPDAAMASSSVASPAAGSTSPVTPPTGFAPLATIEARVAPLLAKGCTIDTSRYSGEVVILSGTATDMRAVSEALRALDGRVREGEAGRVGSGVELLSIEATPEGRYRFEIRLPASSLTRT